MIFNEGLGKIAEKYLTKGAKVLLEGKLATRKWQDRGHRPLQHRNQLTPYNGMLTFLNSKRDGERAAGGEPEVVPAAQAAIPATRSRINLDPGGAGARGVPSSRSSPQSRP